MGKIQRRSRRRAERADASDFYQQLEEFERNSPRADRRGSRRGEEPFGERKRTRNRRRQTRQNHDVEQQHGWDEAG